MNVNEQDLVLTLLLGSMFWLISAVAGAYADTDPRGRQTSAGQMGPSRTPHPRAHLISHSANIVAAGSLAIGTAVQAHATWTLVAFAVLTVAIATGAASVVVRSRRARKPDSSSSSRPSASGSSQVPR